MDIKVKGRNINQKKMYSAIELANDQLTLLTTGKFINVHSHKQFSQIYDHIIPLFCIGKSDKNGIDIYEGDIISSSKLMSDGENWLGKGVVKYIAKKAAYCIEDKRITRYPSIMYFEEDTTYEVIGNIFENPDLFMS